MKDENNIGINCFGLLDHWNIKQFLNDTCSDFTSLLDTMETYLDLPLSYNELSMVFISECYNDIIPFYGLCVISDNMLFTKNKIWSNIQS